MTEDKSPTYFAIAGIDLPDGVFVLGHGVELTRTYVHLMAHPMAAFSQPEPGKPHPAPWKAVLSNFWGARESSVDIRAQLHCGPFSDGRLESSWDIAAWVTFLIRIKTGVTCTLALQAEEPFRESATSSGRIAIADFDFGWDYWARNVATAAVKDADLQWVADNWYESFRLMKDGRFSFAIFALYQSHRAYIRELQLVTIWTALERLFSDSTNELRFRVSAAIAAYLEPPGETRFNLCRDLMRLYDCRSQVAHGQELKESSATERTADIAKRALVKMIESRHVPSHDQLKKLLFGWDVISAFTSNL